MIKIDEIEQFEKESLPQIKHQYWQLNSQTFPKEMNSFVVALKEKFADVFGKLGDIVQKKDCRVGKITISLIRQSVREGKPRAVIEAFDRTGADKKLLYTDDMDISWLFSTWQTYREMLEKKVKQQILAFCLRHNYRYDGNSHWTAAHLKWLKALILEALYKEILDEYLLTYQTLSDKLERLDKRIEELATQDEYKEAVKKLCCFIGVKTHTALSVLVEVGDFKRFASAQHFASYLGLVPGEDSSGDDQNRLGITKAGNRHVRLLLTEASQCYARGQVGFKSKELKSRQSGNTPAVIAYADKANERLRRRYYKMVLNKYKKHNVAKTAIARELACFMWGMMTDNIV